MHKPFAAALALLALPLLLAAQDKPDRPPWAQPSSPQPSPPATPPAEGPVNPTDEPSVQQAPAPPASRGTVKVNVNLVTVLVSVLDEHNRPAPNLPFEAFQILEEGVPQKIDIFEAETHQPLDIALMIDASLSAHIEKATEQDAASHFIQQILRPEDRLSVFAFDEQVRQLPPYFSDKISALQEAVHKIPDGAGTSIYDAVLLGSDALQKRRGERRRVIIMVTDAGETTSRSDFEAARKAALRAGILLYTVVIRPVKNENGRNTAGEHALQTITDTTGGAMFFPVSPQELPIIFDRINSELRTQYRLAYYPNPRGPANTYRTIEVKVLPGYTARHRTTYLTGPQ
ncbi:MAG TPA: VWA domain-containing protein [Candidatus Acidoferrales bacterium]|nr:VWA domain-containing protein [Candidatus Acidoferrales bacterium]